MMAEIIHQPRTKSFFLRSDWLSPLTTSPLCSQSTASLLVGFLELTCKVETTLLWTPKKQEESGTRRQHASPPASHFLVSMTGSTRRLMRYNAPVRQEKSIPAPGHFRLVWLTWRPTNHWICVTQRVKRVILHLPVMECHVPDIY